MDEKKTVPLTIEVDGERHLIGEAEVSDNGDGTFRVQAKLDKSMVTHENVSRIVDSLTDFSGMSIGPIIAKPKLPRRRLVDEMYSEALEAIRNYRPPNKEQ